MTEYVNYYSTNFYEKRNEKPHTMIKRIDLHTHSNYSDGTLSPAALVDLAKKNNVAAIAVTDHDTMAGTSEAIGQGIKQGVEVIPGIEISAKHNDIAIHILGYGLDQDEPNLRQSLDKLQKARRTRNQAITAKLNNHGIELELAELRQLGKGQIGRPHFARLLVKKGVVKTVNAAFARFLKRGGSAYVECYKLPAAEAIQMIKNAGGLAVLAHPGSIDPTLATLPALLQSLKDNGLAGLELYYPTHSIKICKALKKIGEELDLLFCGGSDFHGDIRKDLPLGGSKKTGRVPYDVWVAMKEKLSRINR